MCRRENPALVHTETIHMKLEGTYLYAEEVSTDTAVQVQELAHVWALVNPQEFMHGRCHTEHQMSMQTMLSPFLAIVCTAWLLSCFEQKR